MSKPSASPQSRAKQVWWDFWRRFTPAALVLLALEGVLLVGIALTTFYFRFADLEQIEVGGDALKVWEFARSLNFGGDVPTHFNHHTARWGLVLPTLWVQKFWGAEATSYFIGPLLASTLLSVFVYLIGRRLSGSFAGVFAVLLLLYFPEMQRASSQILPEAYGPMYTMGAYFFALLFCDARRVGSRALYLALTGGFLVCAYASKMVYLYFAPGAALLIWLGAQKPLGIWGWQRCEAALEKRGSWAKKLNRTYHYLESKNLLAPALLASGVVALIVFEVLLFLTQTDGKSGGRLAVVSRSHGMDTHTRIRSFSDFFALYTQAYMSWKIAFAAVIPSLLGVLAFARSRRAKLFACGLLLFACLQTFVLRSLDPPTPWLRPHPRYLLAMAAPMAIVVGVFLSEALSGLSRRLAERRATAQKRDTKKQRASLPQLSEGTFPRWVGTLVALLTLWALVDDTRSRLKKAETRGAYAHTERMAEEINKKYKEGVLFYSATYDGKPAWAIYAAYLSPATLLEVDGRIESGQDGLLRIGRGRAAVRQLRQLRREYKDKKLAQVVSALGSRKRCFVALDQNARHFRYLDHQSGDCAPFEAYVRGEEPLPERPRSRRPSQKRRGP